MDHQKEYKVSIQNLSGHSSSRHYSVYAALPDIDGAGVQPDDILRTVCWATTAPIHDRGQESFTFREEYYAFIGRHEPRGQSIEWNHYQPVSLGGPAGDGSVVDAGWRSTGELSIENAKDDDVAIDPYGIGNSRRIDAPSLNTSPAGTFTIRCVDHPPEGSNILIGVGQIVDNKLAVLAAVPYAPESIYMIRPRKGHLVSLFHGRVGQVIPEARSSEFAIYFRGLERELCVSEDHLGHFRDDSRSGIDPPTPYELDVADPGWQPTRQAGRHPSDPFAQRLPRAQTLPTPADPSRPSPGHYGDRRHATGVIAAPTPHRAAPPRPSPVAYGSSPGHQTSPSRTSAGPYQAQSQQLTSSSPPLPHSGQLELRHSPENGQQQQHRRADEDEYNPDDDGEDEGENQYELLREFDTVFLVDDSFSMRGQSWHEVKAVLEEIAPFCTRYDSDGIDVYFLNHKSTESPPSPGQAAGGYYQLQDEDDVAALFSKITPRGGTMTGMRLRNLLKPYLKLYKDMKATGQEDDVKPLNVIIITDGVAQDDPEAEVKLVAKELDRLEAPPEQVGLQFFQVGNEPGVKEELDRLDNEIAADGSIRDIVDTVTWDRDENGSTGSRPSLSMKSILNVVLGAVIRRIDNRRQ